jgi:ubiquinone/menaquinone biosynthesis C-methylase UbiE
VAPAVEPRTSWRNLGPAAYAGLDLNPASVDKCRARHNLSGLDFVQGDAEDLPFPDQSFDAVINVEASQQYQHFPRFLAEVNSLIRYGVGIMDWDLRRAGGFSYRVYCFAKD